MSAASESPSRSVAAVILAAGQGKRMKSDLPKVLHKVCGAPMVLFPIEAAAAAGVTRTVVVLGVGREKVEKALAGLQGVEFAHQERPLGTGHAVLAARSALAGFDGDLLVLPGDSPCVRPETAAAILSIHRERGADATVLTVEHPGDPSGYGRIVRDDAGRIRRIVEERDATAAERKIAEINSGMYAFRAAALWPALDRVKPDNVQGEYYLTDVLRILIADGRPVSSVLGPFEDGAGINDRAQLAEASALVRARVLDRLMRESGVTVVDPATTHVEAGVEVGRDTIIEPFTVIRRGARIGAGCHVGPFAHVAEGAVLEDGAEIGNFVEIKRSRMGKKAKAKHLAYLGDGDVGAGANIGAGTIFCNYDGKNKHKTLVGEKAFIGSGSLLVAPVEVGAGATTGAGAVVTRGKRIPPGETWIGVPARPLGEVGQKGAKA